MWVGPALWTTTSRVGCPSRPVLPPDLCFFAVVAYLAYSPAAFKTRLTSAGLNRYKPRIGQRVEWFLAGWHRSPKSLPLLWACNDEVCVAQLAIDLDRPYSSFSSDTQGWLWFAPEVKGFCLSILERQ